MSLQSKKHDCESVKKLYVSYYKKAPKSTLLEFRAFYAASRKR